MGDLSLGTYTIQNIAYDSEKQAFYRDYSTDGVSLFAGLAVDLY